MPEPITMSLILAAKGAMAIGKYAFAKGVIAKTAVVTSHYVIPTVGVATTVGACAIVGKAIWTTTNIRRAREAYNASVQGDNKAAASILMNMAASVNNLDVDAPSELAEWARDEYPISEVPKLVGTLKSYADEISDASDEVDRFTKASA